MRFKLAGVFILLASTSVATVAEAGFFIRPYVQLGAGVIDALDQNVETSGSANFTTALQSHVSLSEGTVRNYLQISGPDAGGSGFGSSAGIFGDRLTFQSAAATTIDFSFSFDGSIISPAINPNLNSLLQIGVTANLRVFDISAGATYANFTSLAGALVSESVSLSFSNPLTDLNQLIDQTLSDSLLVQSGLSTFDVFASLSIFVSTNANPVTVTMDFLNTGTFGLGTAPGVTFTSDSGTFLSAQQQPEPEPNPVPEPATLGLLGFGLAGLGFIARRRKSLA